MAQFIDAATHSGNPQDDYNKIQSGYPLEHLKAEAKYILEEAEDGSFSLSKKPEDCQITKITDVWGFLRDHVDAALIIWQSGVYDRFNFDFQTYFPEAE